VKPEEKARKVIDHLLEEADWKVQDFEELDLGASLGRSIDRMVDQSRVVS